MANILKQEVTQQATNSFEKRVIVQYYDDVANEDKQTINNYEDLTTEEKATFDAYQALCESKMV
jgi:hypothetical protein